MHRIWMYYNIWIYDIVMHIYLLSRILLYMQAFAHFSYLQLLVPVCSVPCQVSSVSSSKVVSSRRGTDPAEVQRCFEVNVAAPLRLAQLWAQVRVEQKLGGAVVNVSSQPLELSLRLRDPKSLRHVARRIIVVSRFQYAFAMWHRLLAN